MKPATRAAIATTTNIIGFATSNPKKDLNAPPTAERALPSFGISDLRIINATLNCCNLRIVVPIISKAGPIAAAINPKTTTSFCTGSGAETNFSTNPATASANFLT